MEIKKLSMAEVKKYSTKTIRLLDKFMDLVISGKKTSTIRYGLVFISDSPVALMSRKRTIMVDVTHLDYSKRYKDLTEKDAHADGFESLESLKREIEKFYPQISQDDQITIIRFEYRG